MFLVFFLFFSVFCIQAETYIIGNSVRKTKSSALVQSPFFILFLNFIDAFIPLAHIRIVRYQKTCPVLRKVLSLHSFFPPHQISDPFREQNPS